MDGMSSTRIRARLHELSQERHAAERAGLCRNRAYMDDLEDEIAVLRGELFGRDFG